MDTINIRTRDEVSKLLTPEIWNWNKWSLNRKILHCGTVFFFYRG